MEPTLPARDLAPAEQGAIPLASLVDQAVTTIEPLLAALEHPTRPPPP
jgi:hypothetical protein